MFPICSTAESLQCQNTEDIKLNNRLLGPFSVMAFVGVALSFLCPFHKCIHMNREHCFDKWKILICSVLSWSSDTAFYYYQAFWKIKSCAFSFPKPLHFLPCIQALFSPCLFQNILNTKGSEGKVKNFHYFSRVSVSWGPSESRVQIYAGPGHTKRKRLAS